MRVLIIEDNPKIAAALKHGLEGEGFAADVVNTGYEGEELALTPSATGSKNGSALYDVILLDVMLPDRDGIDLCRTIRRRGVRSKVLILSALGQTTEKVAGLNAGADDYVTKPFELEELVARIHALKRRGDASEDRFLRCDDLELDLFSRTVTRGGKVAPLRNKEFALLEFLMRHPSRVLSRTLLAEKVWDTNYEHNSNTIDVAISGLRRRMDCGFKRRLITTYRGVGYVFDASTPMNL